MEAIFKDKNILLFDGVCNLCSGVVQYYLTKDKHKRLHFASLQSDFGQATLKYFEMPTTNFDTFLFIENGVCYTHSTAALRVLRQLSAPLSWLYIFVIVPRVIRDGVYSWVARNRFWWFGKQEVCWLPSPEWQKRFIPFLL